MLPFRGFLVGATIGNGNEFCKVMAKMEFCITDTWRAQQLLCFAVF